MFAAFEKGQNAKPLPELCMELLSEQKKTWCDLKQGYESLKDIKVRKITCNGFSVRVQHNPGRIRSALADVAEKSVNARPCFLCLNNLPEDQKGVLYHKEFLILCNPMPVFSNHFTIARLIHQPQDITGHIHDFLELMTDFSSNWSVLYNGPRCGASAPDHLHFQVIPSGKMSIEEEVMDEKRLLRIARIDGVLVSRAQSLGREVIVLEGDDPKGMAGTFKRIVAELQKISHADSEPMMSIAGFHDRVKWRLMVFPRAKHRPDAFFREGDARVVVSPAIIEMGGVLVAPVERDFERLDASAVEDIFGEVSLKGEIVQGVIDTVAGSRHNSNSPSR
jgi:hypothetical protein